MEKLSTLENKRREKEREKDLPLTSLEEKYASFIEKKREEAEGRYKEYKLEEAYLSFLYEREKNQNTSPINLRAREIQAKISSLRREEEKREKEDPDYFYVSKEKKFLHDIEEEKKGNLISVPYLEDAKERIHLSLERGIPVYLVGHLGSGKTQLAVEIAKEEMRKKWLFEAAEKSLKEKGANGEDEFTLFCSLFPVLEKEAEEKDFVPYLISGSHNLTSEDMFIEKTLKLEKSTDSYTDEEELNSLIHSFQKFIEENRYIMKDLSSNDQLSLILAGWKTFSDLALAKHRAFGTVVSKVEKEVLKALKEGKPVIIDELNAIAMPNLIALNDLLQHHRGESAYLAGVGKVKIEDGFSLIGTGNLSTETVSYEGTNNLNPAFQSRFTTVVYNYVPQRTEGEFLKRENQEKDELFIMMITHLCQVDGNLLIPDKSKTLDQLYRIAEMARLSQDIFEGKKDRQEKDLPHLSESVLSIRNLFHVLDFWNYGERMDLPMALWEGFLSSVTNSDDRNLLLSLAYRYGIYLESEGWKIESRGRGESALELEDIRLFPYSYVTEPLEKMSSEDVLYLLYGPLPKRKDYPEELRKEIIDDTNETLSIETAERLGLKLEEIEHSYRIIESLEDKKNEG